MSHDVNFFKHKMHIFWLCLALGLTTAVFLLISGAEATPTASCAEPNFPDRVEGATDVSLPSGDYYLDRDALIRDGRTLTITAGSNIIICGDYHIRTNGEGNLRALGLPDQPIVFAREDPNDAWEGLIFDGNLGENSFLQHVVLNKAGSGTDTVDAAIIISALGPNESASPVFDHVTINDSPNYGVAVALDSDDRTPPAFSNVSINNSGRAAVLADAEAVGGFGRGNSYVGNMPNRIQIDSGGGSRLYHSQLWRNQGVPLEVLGTMMVAANQGEDPTAVLTIEEGTTLLMAPDARLFIGTSLGRRGALSVEGTADNPVTFTRIDEQSAPWNSLRLELYPDTAVRLTHTNLSFGGNNSELGTIEFLGNGQLSLDHVTLTNSLTAGVTNHAGTLNVNNSHFEANKYGLEFKDNGRGAAQIRNSTFLNNLEAGIQVNYPHSLCIDAIGNYWGTASGPADSDASDDGCGDGRENPVAGEAVSNGVRYTPWLPGTGGLQDRGSILPDKFYVVADGLDAAQLTITLRNAQGVPLVGKQIVLETSLGTLTQPTQATDANGQTTAVLTSETAGYAYLTAHNTTDNIPITAVGGVTFWQGLGDNGGLINTSGVPYASPQFIVSGRPFQQSLPVGMRVPMRNSNPYSVDVEVVYGVSGFNVGARFAPVYTATQTLAPGESWDAQGVWLPIVTGHRCIQANITIDDGQTSQQQRTPTDLFNFPLQQNTDQDPCDPERLNPQQAIPKKPGGLGTVVVTFGKLYNLARKANRCLSESLSFDQALAGRQYSNTPAYQTVITPPDYTPPLFTTADGLTQAEADALNDLAQTSADLLELNLALGATSQRLNWAAQAANITGATSSSGDMRQLRNNPLAYMDLQYAAYRDFAHEYATKLDLFADQIDALLAVYPEAADTLFVPDDYKYERNELENSGLDSETEQFLLDTGLENAFISELTGDLITSLDNNPAETVTFAEALSNIQQQSRAIATRLREQYPHPQTSLLRQGQTAAAVPVRPIVFTFDVGHPFAEGTETVSLAVRPASFPLGWTYELSNDSFELAAGEITTAMLTMYPDGSQLEDTFVQVAVEGYVNGELVGGAMMQHLTPRLTPRAVGSDVYLPIIQR